MFRYILTAAFAVTLCAVTIFADEIKGKIKSVDGEKGTITVTVGDKDTTYTLAKDGKVVTAVKDGLKSQFQVKEGGDVTIVTDKSGNAALVEVVGGFGGGRAMGAGMGKAKGMGKGMGKGKMKDA